MSYKRRKFLASASAAAIVLAAHEQLTLGAPDPDTRPASNPADPRITEFRLLTAAPLSAMKQFYTEQLGMKLLKESRRSLILAAGPTSITFETATPDQGNPFYHFAFNIPENKILKARDWQLERTELLPVFPRLRDPDYPDDVVHFRHWNAHSVFFLDPAENVVEYIARHDLDNSATGPFGPADILYASEIAFVVDDVPSVGAGVEEAFELKQYRGGSDEFRAIGDEHGLLLFFKKGRRLGVGDVKPRYAEIHPVSATIRGSRTTEHRILGPRHEIRSRQAS